MRQFLLQMAGHSGTGKSTLARAIARETGAALLDKDVIMAGAMRAGVDNVLAAQAAYEVGWGLARSSLSVGQSVILDNAAYFVSIREKGDEIAREFGARYYIIECILRDQREQEARLAARTRSHSLQPTSLDGFDRYYSRAGTAPISEPHLEIDTGQPLPICVEEALAYIGHDAG
jgi:predicted kinase